jgi:hypothetical protein
MSARFSREWGNKLRPYAGKWVASNRDQTKVIAAGRTFEEAKHAALEAGERELFLTEVPPASRWNLVCPPVLYAVAVFVAQVSEIGLGG